MRLIVYLIVSLALGVAGGFIADLVQHVRSFSIICGILVGGVSWMLSSGKQALEIIERYYGVKAKRREWEEVDRKIISPTAEEISTYGVPYRSVDKATQWLKFAKGTKEQEELKPNEFITKASEEKIKGPEPEKGR